jgi:hypothetical protein
VTDAILDRDFSEGIRDLHDSRKAVTLFYLFSVRVSESRLNPDSRKEEVRSSLSRLVPVSVFEQTAPIPTDTFVTEQFHRGVEHEINCHSWGQEQVS